MQLVSYVSGGRGSPSLSLSLSLSISPPSFFRLSGNSSFAADYSEPTDQRSCQVRSICSSILQFSIHFECSEAAAVSTLRRGMFNCLSTQLKKSCDRCRNDHRRTVQIRCLFPSRLSNWMQCQSGPVILSQATL